MQSISTTKILFSFIQGPHSKFSSGGGGGGGGLKKNA